MKENCFALATLLVFVKSQDSSLNCNHYGILALDKCNFEDDGTSYKYTCEDSTEGEGKRVWKHTWNNLKCFREATTSIEYERYYEEWRCDAKSNCAAEKTTSYLSTTDDCAAAINGDVQWLISNQCVMTDDERNTYGKLDCKEGIYGIYEDPDCSTGSLNTSFTDGECNDNGFYNVYFQCGTRVDNVNCNYYAGQALGRCYSYTYDSSAFEDSTVTRNEYSYMYECRRGEIWQKYWDYSLDCNGDYTDFEIVTDGDDGFKCREGNDCSSFKVESKRYARDDNDGDWNCLIEDKLYSRSVSYLPEKKCLPNSYFGNRWTIYECGNNITTKTYDNDNCEGDPVSQSSVEANSEDCVSYPTSSTHLSCSASDISFGLSVIGSFLFTVYHLFV